jgi:uncharacterized protein YjiS (DUF1127 family)
MNSSTIETPVAPGADVSPGSWQAALVWPIRQGIAWIDARRQLQRDVKELVALDDRILRDIGLSRSDIDNAARYGRDFDSYRDSYRDRRHA